MAPRVYGLCTRVLRDPAQAGEVAQEVLVEVWRTATRFDERRGSASAWITTIAHRRAVDRFLAQIAFVVAFGVLLDTVIVRSLLVPALAFDLGRAVWWPSRLSRVRDLSRK
jgi:DNA-directed RNA polymerase specialized sigma24 family protein